MTQDLFRIQRNCLRLMGHQDIYDSNVLPGKIKEQTFKRFLSQLQTMKHGMLLLFIISAQWPMMDYLIYNIDDLVLATACFSIFFTNVLTVIKTATFMISKREFKLLMAEFELMYDELKEAGAKKFLVASNVGGERFVKLYFYTVSCTGLYFAISPLVSIMWRKLQGKAIMLLLPMPLKFRFDFESTPGYQVAYVYTILTIISVVLYATAVDCLFVSFTSNLRGHFQALQHAIETNTYDKTDALLQQDLRAYVQYHCRLLALTQSVQQIFKPIIFGEFLMTSLEVCVIIYQLLMNMGVFMDMVIYCMLLSSILLQLLIYCYGAETLKIESAAVGTVVQMSQWYNLPPRHRHVLQLILLRSQREMISSAFCYEASLPNFLAILKAAMSYIAFIQSIE